MKLVVVAFLAATLVTLAHSAAVMSVDVGTEWFKVAVVSPGVPMEIALNPSSKRKTNVVVSIEGNERKFGDDAMVVCVKKPKYCYAYLLDLLGKKVDHPTVTAYKARFPQYDIEADPIRGTVIFRHDSETTYSVEELLGMILSHAKSQAETFTEQPIKDAVITVPVFFNQVERLALVAAAQLGGLNVLQLMNNPMAVALNYGMFRRKEINGTVKHIMLYDMGAGATTATVIGFQIVKTKDRGFAETHPQAQVLGVGYDRTLGGAELRFRVREFLADKFNALGKTKTDVRTVPRAMGKLLKEAERVKLILSANTDCFAQIENVMEDIDFKEAFSREDLMGLAPDLMARVTKPVEQALSTAGMAMENIDQVILVGGGTRVPKVQELLTEFVGSELGKSLNTDESAAMGAVYKAAEVQVESATLPVATFSKFQPLSKDFLDLTNPKAVLEMRLRHFACLSKGDIVAINYNNRIYELNVLETKPAAAVSIIECDMNVEFEAPPGYEEPKVFKPQPMEEDEPELDISQMLPEDTGFIAFAGSGNRLDGKKKRLNSGAEIQNRQLAEYTRGIPDYNFEVGNIRFIRAKKPKDKDDKENVEDDFKAFEGKGQSLRQAKSKK